MHHSGKVWTIEVPPESPPRPATPSRPSPATRTEPGRTTPTWDRRPTARKAYLIGPVVAALTHRGARRIAWSVLGPGSIAVGAALVAWRSPIRGWLESVPGGDLAWIALGVAVATSIVAAWAEAIRCSRQVTPVRTSRRASWILRPTAATFAGLCVPGLGLMMAGKRQLVASAFWILAPLVSAVTVLGQWRWLVDPNRGDGKAALSGTAGEAVLASAFLVLATSLILWIIQALDGARRVSWGRGGRPGLVSLALVLALGAFATTFRSYDFADDLETQASALQAEGLLLVPWGLCETAARLDPTTPHYQVRGAELATELGWTDVAAARWATLELKSDEWLAARDALPSRARDEEEFVATLPATIEAIPVALPPSAGPDPAGVAAPAGP